MPTSIFLWVFTLLAGCDAPEPPSMAEARSSPAPPPVDIPPAAVPRWTVRDRDAASEIVSRAETDPSALLALDTNPFPPAAAWRGFFASVGYGPATPTQAAPSTPLEAFAALMTALDDAETPVPWPCWVAYRWPVVWGTWALTDSSVTRNKGMLCEVPLRDAPVTHAYVARMNRVVHETTGALVGVCGNVMGDYEQEASILMTVVWYDPRGFASMKLPHSGDTDTIDPVPPAGPLRSPEELLGDMAPPAAWLRYVEGHLIRTHQLNEREARAVSLRLAARLVYYDQAMHDTCETYKEEAAMREAAPPTGEDPAERPLVSWVPYGVAGSKIERPEGIFGFW